MPDKNLTAPLAAPGGGTHAGLTSPLPDNLSPEMLRMVRALAGRLHARLPPGCCVEIADLVQAGNLGVLKALRAFESEVGAPLLSYAKFRVRGEMLDLVRKHLGRETGSLAAAVARLPSGANVEEDLRASAGSSPQAPLFSRQRIEIIQSEVERLPARYRAVMRLRYVGEMTLREIGAALQVNESRACQLHSKALIQLKRALHSRGVSGFSQL